MQKGRSLSAHASPGGSPAAGLYIHVPFCRAKCPYCDFYSIGDRRLIPDYLDALQTELNLRRQLVPAVDTVYFGGGTPSMLTPGRIGRILDQAGGCFALDAHAEVTLEVNPGTVNPENLAAYRAAGVNRLNIGLQSIDDQNLNFLGRIHTAEEGLDAYRWARTAGFENVGRDLIYGLPGQTRRRWEAELTEVARLAADHLSCYTLTIEPGTPLSAQVQNGRVRPLDEATAAALFSLTAVYLNRHGYRQYEISNFARQTGADTRDRRSRHNLKYWTFAPYLGFGPAAHSFLENRRWWNHRALDDYLEDLNSGKPPLAGSETLSREQQIIEFIYLGLRRTDGIDTTQYALRFKEEFSRRFESRATRLMEEGLLEKFSEHIRLTAHGMRFLESVAERLIGG
jgi:oxygen-independent coproporphyrinogen-3 oxidase